MELCRRPGINSKKRWVALTQLCLDLTRRGEVRKGGELVPELVALGEEIGNAGYLAEALSQSANWKMHSGDFEGADQDYDRALALLDSVSMPTADLIQTGRWLVSWDRVTVRIPSACNQWLLGYPDRALERVRIAMAYAREWGLKSPLAARHFYASTVYELRREFAPMRGDAAWLRNRRPRV